MKDRILVTQPSMPPMEEYINEIKDLWESRWLTNMGEKHQKLQDGLRTYLGVDCLELVVNGHMALELALQMMKLEGEVITTPFTFVSTTHAIVRSGLTPVFCDIDPETLTIDASKIEALITDRTCAIMPVHVYGNICNVEEIGRIAEKHGLKVIYDAAHAFGEEYKGRGIGCYGDASCFSFHATKVFHTVEGGAVCCRKEKPGGGCCNCLKNFGIQGSGNIAEIGTNAKMNEFCAAMGICNLRHVEEEINRRRKAAERYRERLEGCTGLKLPKLQKEVKSNYAYFPVIFLDDFGADRNAVYDALAADGIMARKYFYPLTSAFDCYKDRYHPSETPAALDISNRVLTLPMYAHLPFEAVDRICDIIWKTGKG